MELRKNAERWLRILNDSCIEKSYTQTRKICLLLYKDTVFFNTHPYLASPVLGVTLALEEDKANGAPVTDDAIQGVKVGMMGPLPVLVTPVFWYTVRPIVGALGASMAISGNVMGPILFFVIWNVIRLAFLWYTQEFGYNAGSAITNDMSGGMLQKVTRGASMMGMFVLGALIERWVNIKFTQSFHKPLSKRVVTSNGTSFHQVLKVFKKLLCNGTWVMVKL